jgi:hypothetical protein
LYSQLKTMSYDDILKTSLRITKEKSQPVFSDIIGATAEVGRLAEFIKETEININAELEHPNAQNTKYKNQIENLLQLLKFETDSNNRWLTLIGILERKIIQLRLYRNIQVSFSTQIQKSGEKKFNYILLRAPFMDLYSGKKEIRVYYKKIEDFVGYNSIEELKENNEFKAAAIETIRKEMELTIEKEGISIDYLRDELNKIEQSQNKSKIELIAKQQNTASQLKEEIKTLKKRIEELEK